jgi:hypothetical protein
MRIVRQRITAKTTAAPAWKSRCWGLAKQHQRETQHRLFYGGAIKARDEPLDKAGFAL